jgi:nicotinate-nucleotide adenylyltransferase
VCAQEARGALGLDVVRLVPVRHAPHRRIEGDPGAEVRGQLCEAAVADDDRLELSRVELDRDGPSYTVETLRQLRERSPRDDHVLILGADQASRLREWRDPDEVLSLATVAVAAREGMERESVLRRLEGLEGHEALEFFEMPRLDISSSLLRERAAAGRPLRYLVPDAVAELIRAQGLYRAQAPAGAAAE